MTQENSKQASNVKLHNEGDVKAEVARMCAPATTALGKVARAVRENRVEHERDIAGALLVPPAGRVEMTTESGDFGVVGGPRDEQGYKIKR